MNEKTERKYSWSGFHERLSPRQALLAYQMAVSYSIPIQSTPYTKFSSVLNQIAKKVDRQLPDEEHKPEEKDIESLLRHMSKEKLNEDDLRE